MRSSRFSIASLLSSYSFTFSVSSFTTASAVSIRVLFFEVRNRKEEFSFSERVFLLATFSCFASNSSASSGFSVSTLSSSVVISFSKISISSLSLGSCALAA